VDSRYSGQIENQFTLCYCYSFRISHSPITDDKSSVNPIFLQLLEKENLENIVEEQEYENTKLQKREKHGTDLKNTKKIRKEKM